MKTRITELFGIEYPIICGGMHLFSEPKLCAAISNAGGLGNITASNYQNTEILRDAIRETKRLTDKPFSVNITWLPYSQLTQKRINESYKVCCEEHVEVIEATGSPADVYVDQVHEAGGKIIQKVGSVRHALHAESAGFDAVVVVGYEEGGHPLKDNVTTMVLVPRVSESVSIPVIAGGGIADGRGVSAALALGADGVVMATRFLLMRECILNDNIKEHFLRQDEYDTSVVRASIGLQIRVLKTDLSDQIIGVESSNEEPEIMESLISGTGIELANNQGDVNGAIWCVGQSIGLVNDIPTSNDFITHTVAEAEACLKGALRSFSE